MENLKQEISKKLKLIEKMILENEDKEKIDKERKKLDNMLEEYIEQI